MLSNIVRRGCASAAGVSALLHLAMITSVAQPVSAVIIGAMATACLYCARDLWLRDSMRTWCVVVVMNGGMIAAHWSLPGCHSPVAAATVAPSSLMTVATCLAAIEAAAAVAVMWRTARRRANTLYGSAGFNPPVNLNDLSTERTTATHAS